MRAPNNQGLPFEEEHVSEVGTFQPLQSILVDLFSVYNKGVALSVKSIDLVLVRIVEALLWEVFTHSLRLDLVTLNLLDDLFCKWVVRKMMVSLTRMIVKAIVYLIVIDEAACCKRLEEAADRGCMVIDLEFRVDCEVTENLFLIED